MEAKLFTCSESAALDARTNTLSLFHLTEELNSPAFPVVVPRLTIVALLVRRENEPERGELQLRIAMGEQELYRGPFQFNFQRHLRSKAIVDLQGLVMLTPGTLRISLYDGDREMGTWPIVVNHVGQPAIQVQPALA